MYDSILLPVDDGDGIGEAVDQAVELARENDATLYILYVINKSKGEAGLVSGGRGETFEELQEEGERILENVADCCRQYDIDLITHIAEGEPYRVIVQYANEINADLVVMGSRRRNGVSRLLHGSVTERVSRHISRPVLVVDYDGDLSTGETKSEQIES